MVAGVCGLVLGFGAPAAVAQEFPETDPAITDGSAQKQLDTARARWKKAHISSYKVRVALGCFCPETIRKPRTLTVRGGGAVKPPQHLTEVATVPRMFRTIQKAIDGKVAAITVAYSARGVPRSITIDRSRMTVDEEQYFTIDRFKPLKK